MIKNFVDLQAWQEAHKLTLQVYKATNSFPKEEMFGLTSQIRRAVISIESNIAEGFSRFHYKDRTKFYYDARGSISEVQSQSITAKDLGYLKEDIFRDIFSQIEKVGAILGGLIRSTKELIKKK